MHVQQNSQPGGKSLIRRLITADGSPHRVALGVAIGSFVGLLPVPGLQMLLAGALALVFGAHKALSLSLVWITNAFTSLPIFLFNYAVGCILLRRDSQSALFCGLFGRLMGEETIQVKIHLAWSLARELLLPLWVGSLVVATVFACVGYACSRYAVGRYRRLDSARQPDQPAH